MPDDHLHLVQGVKSGDLDDLAVKIFGMSATNPKENKEFIKTMKIKIINNVIRPHMFNSTAYRWLLDQYKVYANIVATDCDGSHKMPETDFMEIIINELSKYIPTFTNIYQAAELSNEPWTLMDLKEKLKVLAEKGKLKIEPATLAAIEKTKANKKIKLEAKSATPWQVTGYGIDDQSNHNYAADAFYEGEQVARDGTQRNDVYSYYMGEQHGGYPTPNGKGSPDWGGKGKGKGGDGKGKGKGGAYPYGKGKGGYGKGGDGKGKGGKGKGGAYPYGKGGNGAMGG
jgi:hypothetical protein